MVLFVGMVALAVFLWRITPGSLVPDEDQGYYIGAVFLPDGATPAAHRRGGEPRSPSRP